MERREWTNEIGPDIRIRVSTDGRPFVHYAARLEIRQGDRWTVIRLIDNADDPADHHMHRYTGTDKQPAERFANGTPDEVLPQAIRYLLGGWEAILRSWRQE
jgi:hypothetical protein